LVSGGEKNMTIIDSIVNNIMAPIVLIWYIVENIIDTFLLILNGFYTPIAIIVNSFINFGNHVLNFYATIFLNMFPSTISAIVFVCIAFVIALRIWSFVSKISIFGFKVG
jgi:hypothetical protein